jgi:photosystem II stability/assembly factor-like uncharacterized protein
VDSGLWPTGAAFWDPEHGVIVGGLADGLRGCPRCRGEIGVTSDGGRTWKRLSVFPNVRPTQVVAGPAGFAWMTAVNCPPCSLRLFRTSDGARLWHRSVGANLRSLSFADAGNGWAIPTRRTGPLRGPVIVRTINGGETWRTVKVGCPGRIDPTALSFPTPSRGWVVCAGQPGAGYQEKAIVQTTDAGATWNVLAEVAPPGAHAVAPDGGLPVGGSPEGLSFLRNGQGWLYGGRMNAVRTFDGGRTWHRTALGTPAGDVQPTSIGFLDARHGFALVHNGNLRTVRMLSTTDGGAHWTVVYAWPARL